MKKFALSTLFFVSLAHAETLIIQEDPLVRVEVLKGTANREVLKVRVSGRTLVFAPNNDIEVRRLETLLNSAISGQCLLGRMRMAIQCQEINKCSKVPVQTYYKVRVELEVDSKNVIQSFKDQAVAAECGLETK